MMRQAMGMIAAAAMLAAGSGLAQTALPKGGGPLDKDKKICRAEAPTGSLVVRKKICKTRAHWDAERREAQDAAGKMQEPRYSCGATNPGIC